MTKSVIKRFLEDELKLIEIQGGELVKEIRVPIPTFYISSLTISKEILTAVMTDDTHMPEYTPTLLWYEYKQFANKLKELTHLNFFIPSDDYLDYAFKQHKELKNNFKIRPAISIYCWTRETAIRTWAIDDEHIGFNLLCSIGNGHEEILLVIASTDRPENHSYTKDDEEKIQNILNRLDDIRKKDEDYNIPVTLESENDKLTIMSGLKKNL